MGNFKYENGHQFYASLNSIKNQRSWCVGRARLTLDDAKQIALSRNGQCLSEKYINHLPLLWRCIEGHLWHAQLNRVKSNDSWCPCCARLTLEDAKKIAFNQNGQCLSEKYVNSQSPLLWCCNKGIHDGKHWCPYCSKYKRENLCREIVSKYLGPPSKIRQPDFLETQIMDFLSREEKELCEDNWIVLRYVWYYEDPYIVIPEYLRESGLIE
ncbi:hypothetical protein Glove_11g77 [Diversispora epigaea]|uniref:Zinc-ribbon domain-containing protein n=1 Tax=Diversispora epigaea TaxID=1348612 RepID=A0A397JS82_9GLOM|nr:hypothetical protein Glove_11g77 [Diversispora epigaea]